MAEFKGSPVEKELLRLCVSLEKETVGFFGKKFIGVMHLLLLATRMITIHISGLLAFNFNIFRYRSLEVDAA